MNSSEELAAKYLQTLNLGIVIFEPDGNIPPDFCVGGTIAVEVRRLNQNYEALSGTTQGLEELDIPLRQKMKKYLRGYAPSRAGECWYVGYGFKRPLEPWHTLRPLIEAALLEFISSPTRQRKKIRITKSFDIDFMRAGVDHGSFFVLGANMDQDSGGWVMAEVERNLRICIAEKEKKIAPFRSRYSKWWLVLADHIDYGMDAEDHPRFKSEVMPRIAHTFDRIVLLDPRDFRRSLEA